MNNAPVTFDAGRPRLSGPIHRLAKPLGSIARPMAGTRWFPLWAIVRHTGRTSGKAYATPVVALRTSDGFIIPLPFGDATQWAKNLFAAGGGSLRSAGREHEIGEPRIVEDEVAAAHLPRLVRFAAGRLGLRQFVLVRRPERPGDGFGVVRERRRPQCRRRRHQQLRVVPLHAGRLGVLRDRPRRQRWRRHHGALARAVGTAEHDHLR